MTDRSAALKEPTPSERREFLIAVIDEIETLLASPLTRGGESAVSNAAADTIGSVILATNWPHDPERSTVKLQGRAVRGEWILSICERDLAALLREAAQRGFNQVAGVFRAALQNHVKTLTKEKNALEIRQHQGERIAAVGRLAKKLGTDALAKRVCKDYARVRPTCPGGRRGNGEALQTVALNIGPLSNGRKCISIPGIRKILKREGVICQ